jgi:serine/threonine protein kinase
VIKIRWIRQLLDAVDFLFECGIAHQDVVPRNLLVDDATDSIKLFDFDSAAFIGPATRHPREGFQEERTDVKGVIFTVYEIITRDDSPRSRPHEERADERTRGQMGEAS